MTHDHRVEDILLQTPYMAVTHIDNVIVIDAVFVTAVREHRQLQADHPEEDEVQAVPVSVATHTIAIVVADL